MSISFPLFLQRTWMYIFQMKETPDILLGFSTPCAGVEKRGAVRVKVVGG